VYIERPRDFVVRGQWKCHPLCQMHQSIRSSDYITIVFIHRWMIQKKANAY